MSYDHDENGWEGAEQRRRADADAVAGYECRICGAPPSSARELANGRCQLCSGPPVEIVLSQDDFEEFCAVLEEREPNETLVQAVAQHFPLLGLRSMEKPGGT